MADLLKNLTNTFLANGLSLTEAKNLSISTAIKGFMDLGLSVRDAADLVLGEGASAKLAADVYDALRTQAAA